MSIMPFENPVCEVPEKSLASKKSGQNMETLESMGGNLHEILIFLSVLERLTLAGAKQCFILMLSYSHPQKPSFP